MRDAIVPQDLQQIRRRIGFHRIKRLARKLLYKEAGSARSGVRAVEDNRFVGRESANYRPCVRKNVQFKGPPNGKVRTRQPCG